MILEKDNLQENELSSIETEITDRHQNDEDGAESDEYIESDSDGEEIEQNERPIPTNVKLYEQYFA